MEVDTLLVKKGKWGKEEGNFLITFKFCKQNVSFSLTRTFICPQAVSRLARLLSQFKCRLKWSKVVFVHALCSQFPLAMLSNCCLHKGFAWDLLQWADVKVYVLYRAAQCPARKHCTACLGSIHVSMEEARFQLTEAPPLATFCLKLFHSFFEPSQQGYRILSFPESLSCC